MERSLTEPWTLGGLPVPNRVVLAPLAGIGNWFVRLQARRHGAGLVVSEMVSSFAIHYRNERTLRELLRIHPDVGCELCAGVCPARCIYVRGADNPPDAPVSPGERYGFVYEINYLRCIHCDLCVEACPTEAITETKLFEFSFTNRNDAIYTKRELLVDDDGRARRQPWELWLGGEDDDTSAWMRATSPSGLAAYEGRVAWSGELGFGVREPERGQREMPALEP